MKFYKLRLMNSVSMWSLECLSAKLHNEYTKQTEYIIRERGLRR